MPLVVAAVLAGLVGCDDTDTTGTGGGDPTSDEWSVDNVRRVCEQAAEESEMSLDDCLEAMGPEYER